MKTKIRKSVFCLQMTVLLLGITDQHLMANLADSGNENQTLQGEEAIAALKREGWWVEAAHILS